VSLKTLLWQAQASLRAAPARVLVLALGLSLVAGLPLSLRSGVGLLEAQVRARAASTPLVLGAPGGTAELVLSTLYFRGGRVEGLPLSARTPLLARGDVAVVAVEIGAQAQGLPVVGVDVDYFAARGLRLLGGRLPAVTGEVVLGAAAAERLGLGTGEQVRSDPPESADFTGPTSVLLDVSGVLAPTGSPDDGVLFTDLSTAWLLAGELHAHAPATTDEQLSTGEASAAVFLFEELDDAARARVHGHGAALPVSGLLLFPDDARAHDQVLAELSMDPAVQVARPSVEVQRVMDIVLRVEDGLVGLFALVGLAMVGLLAVIVGLDWRLRAEERVLLDRLGAPRWWMVALVAVELALIGVIAALLAVAQVGGARLLLARLLVGG